MKSPLVSIIVLNYNGLTDTLRCINSLKRLRYANFEVILVDNGSDNQEGTKLLKKFSEFCKVILSKKNLGFTGGNNLAVKKAKGKYIFLLNNDTVATSNCLNPMIQMLENDKHIAVAQPKIKMLTNKKFFEYAGATGGYIDKFGYSFTRGRIFDTNEKDVGQYNKPSPIFWASGAACLIRKSVIKKVGGLFDPIFFNYMEEIDFCWRAWKVGYQVYFCPESMVYHKGATSSGKNLFQKRYWEHKNNLILLYKNLPNIEFVKKFMVRIVLESACYIHYLSTFNFTYLKSLFSAHVDFLKLLVGKQITKNKSFGRTKVAPPIFASSIAYHYFILSRKRFSQLGWSSKGNVSFIIFNTKPSGGLKLILTSAQLLEKKGYNIKIFSVFNGSIEWFSSKMKVYPLTKYFNYVIPKILIFTFWPTVFLYKIFPAQNKYYLVMDSELFYKNKLLRSLLRLSFKFNIQKITISKFLRSEINSATPKTNPPIIDTSQVDYKQFLNRRKFKNINGGKIRITSIISTYEYYKGIDLLTETVKKLKNIDTGLNFTLISRERHVYNPVFDRFYSNPSTKKIIELLKNSDILLATSRVEGFYLPGLEAMASGCILVSTNSYGILDYAKNKYNAIIVDKYEDIWEKNVIRKTLSDTELSKKLIQNGIKTAKSFISKKKNPDLEKIVFFNN